MKVPGSFLILWGYFPCVFVSAASKGLRVRLRGLVRIYTTLVDISISVDSVQAAVPMRRR
jgi:hypothetical protein